MITNVSVNNAGSFDYIENGNTASARFDLFLIKRAWEKGVNFDDVVGYDTDGDWSPIRDANKEQTRTMLERALNFFFGDKKPVSATVKSVMNITTRAFPAHCDGCGSEISQYYYKKYGGFCRDCNRIYEKGGSI